MAKIKTILKLKDSGIIKSAESKRIIKKQRMRFMKTIPLKLHIKNLQKELKIAKKDYKSGCRLVDVYCNKKNIGEIFR